MAKQTKKQSKPKPPKAKRGGRASKPRRDVYQEVTDQILAALDAGTVPWRNPILSSAPPANLHSKRPYRGVNVFLLAMAALARGYASPWWLTFKQALARGGSVRKGERATQVVFWKLLEKEEQNDAGEVETTKLPVLRFYSVFNTDQCDGLDVPPPETLVRHHEPVEECDAIARCYCQRSEVQVVHGSKRAVYDYLADAVMLPYPRHFESAEEYHGTLFHELAHSTGHPSRLARRKGGELVAFGSQPYGREELVAECAAAFVSAEAGIGPRTIANQAAYIAGWKRTIRADKRVVVLAAAAGQRAADLILGRSFDQEEPEGEKVGNDLTPSVPAGHKA